MGGEIQRPIGAGTNASRFWISRPKIPAISLGAVPREDHVMDEDLRLLKASFTVHLSKPVDEAWSF